VRHILYDQFDDEFCAQLPMPRKDKPREPYNMVLYLVLTKLMTLFTTLGLAEKAWRSTKPIQPFFDSETKSMIASCLESDVSEHKTGDESEDEDDTCKIDFGLSDSETDSETDEDDEDDEDNEADIKAVEESSDPDERSGAEHGYSSSSPPSAHLAVRGAAARRGSVVPAGVVYAHGYTYASSALFRKKQRVISIKKRCDSWEFYAKFEKK